MIFQGGVRYSEGTNIQFPASVTIKVFKFVIVNLIVKKEEIAVAAQLLTAMKDAVIGMEEAKRKKDNGEFIRAKREILKFQKDLDELL